MRILVVDGHPAMRLGIRVLLDVTGGMCVVGEAGNGEEAVRLVEESQPDLAVVGLNLNGEPDGIEVCRRLKTLPEPPRVLVHAACDFATGVSSCLLAGADGYLHKGACGEQLVDAVRRVVCGERIWSANNEIDGTGLCVRADRDPAYLTPKEREVFTLILRRCSNADIAGKLYLSLPTVKTHVRSILRKLGAKSRRELFRPLALETSDF